MKYLFDISPLIGAKTGIYRYTHSLSKNLGEQSQDFQPFFFAYQEKSSVSATNELARMFPELGVENFFLGKGNLINSKIIRALYRENERLASRSSKGIAREINKIKREAIRCGYRNLVKVKPENISQKQLQEVVLYHSPHPRLPSGIERKKKFSNRTKYGVTIHDMIPIIHSDWFSKTTGFHKIMKSIQFQDFVITDSHKTKEDFCNYNEKFDSQRVFVVPLGVSEEFKPPKEDLKWEEISKTYGITKGRYYLSLCTLEPRKNLITIVRSFCSLIESKKIVDTQLVLVGKIGWKQEQMKECYELINKYKKHIFITGFIDDELLPYFYSNSLAFVFASLYEGFGLPPLEAMACGAPVICSTSSSLPEVVGDAALAFEPREQEELQEQMLRVYENDGLVKSLQKKSIDQAASFSWKKTALETLSVYKKLV